MTLKTNTGVCVAVLAIGLAACDARAPSGPTPLPPAARSTPIVTVISPSTGSTVSPTHVTISGTGFLAGATVMVDVRAVNVNIVDSSTITANIPARAAGTADVVVTNPGDLRATLTGAFTFFFEESIAVTASTDVVDAGGQIRVSWTAPSARQGDWIALFTLGGTTRTLVGSHEWRDVGHANADSPDAGGAVRVPVPGGWRFSRPGAQQTSDGAMSVRHDLSLETSSRPPMPAISAVRSARHLTSAASGRTRGISRRASRRTDSGSRDRRGWSADGSCSS
jgi:hypothetical protein